MDNPLNSERMVTNAFMLLAVVTMLTLLSCKHETKFDSIGWQQQSDPAFPSEKRKFMLNDLLKNYELKGKHYSEITHLLGSADFSEGGNFGYVIEEDYGSDIDPVYMKNLLFTLQDDSTVNTVEVKEWKK
jgi:hypothetical protein